MIMRLNTCSRKMPTEAKISNRGGGLVVAGKKNNNISGEGHGHPWPSLIWDGEWRLVRNENSHSTEVKGNVCHCQDLRR